MNSRCRLCLGETSLYYKETDREFVVCNNCESVQLLPEYFISAKAEEDRYLTHNNDVEDRRYQEFVEPITSRISGNFTSKHIGLDYGCGTGPVAATELGKKGYTVKLYDPFFHPDTAVLETFYDFIICCEVMEHFFEPGQEFSRLSQILNAGGKLYCKTSLFSEEIDFKSWYYKNDPTHVFFYTGKSLEWIRKNMNFSTVEILPKVIVFSK